jgi:anti-anti-sigma factor
MASRAARLQRRVLPQWEVEEIEEGARVLVYEPRLDALTAQALGDLLLSLVGRRRLELDLSNVRFLCATCLGKLIALDRRLRACGGHLVLLDVTPAVYEIFEITHLHAVLDVRAAC